MNKELELGLEINRLRDDIQSSDIIQVKPYINSIIKVSNPKWHLQIHVNTIERLVNEVLNTSTAELLTYKFDGNYPDRVYCSSCYEDSNLVILDGWEKYCPICGVKFIKKGVINNE